MRYINTTRGLFATAALLLLALGACGGSSAITTAALLPAGAPAQPEVEWVMVADEKDSSAWARDVGGVAITGVDGVFIGGHVGDVILAKDTAEAVRLQGTSAEDAYVARARASDGRLEWVRTIKSLGDGWVVIGDVCRTPGGIAVVGYFQGALRFFGTDQDQDPLEETLSVAFDDGFVAHYSQDGDFEWARVIKSPGYAECLTVTALGDGSIVVGGLFTDVIKPGCLIGDEMYPAGSMDAFLAAYDMNGCHLWSRQFESEKGGFVSIWSVVPLLGAADDLVVSGDFKGMAGFGLGVDRASVADSVDCFVVRLDGSSRAVEWIQTLGGPGNERSMDMGVAGPSALPFIRLAGGFRDTAMFGEPGPDEVLLTSAGEYDGFLAAYDGDGVFQWATSAGGPADDFLCDVAVRPSDGAAMAVGFFVDFCRFSDSPVIINSHGLEDQDGLLVGYDADGVAEWAVPVGGTGEDCVSGIKDIPGNPAGDVFVTGAVSGKDIRIGLFPLVNLEGNDTAFHARLIDR